MRMASTGKVSDLGGSSSSETVKRRKVLVPTGCPISCNASECMTLHIVYTGEELCGDSRYQNEDFTFEPEFADRVFGEEGKIYGYTGLKIDIWLHCLTFHVYADINYTSKFENAGAGKATTDILSLLKEAFGEGLTEDREFFLQNIARNTQAFKKLLEDHGEVIFSSNSGTSTGVSSFGSSDLKVEGDGRQILRMELTHRDVLDWHSRLTPLTMLFVEGSQPIKSEDPLWEVYVTVEWNNSLMKVVGYCNVYRFYHYPDSVRMRVSQILVLPPHQKKGYGLELLETVNQIAIHRDCFDVTMEEPSERLQLLRDTMDVLHLLSVASVNTEIDIAIARLTGLKVTSGEQQSTNGSGKNWSEGLGTLAAVKKKNLLLPPAFLKEEVRQQLKISKMQFKRCWEELLFLFLDPHDDDLQEIFRELLVHRLNLELFEKENGRNNLGKCLLDTENEYDSSKTFVMMKARHFSSCAVNFETSKALSSGLVHADVELQNGAVKNTDETLLQDFLKERMDELLAVAEAVSRHCKSLGLSPPYSSAWDQGLPDASITKA